MLKAHPANRFEVEHPILGELVPGRGSVTNEMRQKFLLKTENTHTLQLQCLIWPCLLRLSTLSIRFSPFYSAVR